MKKISEEEAQAAIKLLIEYIGDSPDREGVIDTPARVVKSYQDIFSGYEDKIEKILDKRFHDIHEFDDIVLLKSINFNSFCEHHMLPFFGVVDIAYIPNGAVVGISKIARLVDAFSKRLQIQESMTSQIAESLQKYLNPKGVAVKVSAEHSCMTLRGVRKREIIMETVHFTGCFKDDEKYRMEFRQMIA